MRGGILNVGTFADQYTDRQHVVRLIRTNGNHFVISVFGENFTSSSWGAMPKINGEGGCSLSDTVPNYSSNYFQHIFLSYICTR